MSLGSENCAAPLSAADVAAVTGNNGNGWGGFGGDWLIAIVILFLFPMMFGGWGGGMFGGMGGWGNGGMMAAANGALTRADLCAEFNFNGLENAVRGVTQGLCDGFYAMQNSINGLGTTVMQGFHGVDNAICNLGYQTQQGFNATQVAMMQGFNAAQAQAADCCCKTQTGLMQVGNQIERGFCQTNYNDQANTTAIIQNAHNDTDRVLAKLDAMEMSRKDETIANLRQQLQAADFRASQATERAAFGAMIDASTAEILRRSGHDCPSAAYIVQPPTPVNFPTNSCGQFNGWNQGCGQGCGNCC